MISHKYLVSLHTVYPLKYHYANWHPPDLTQVLRIIIIMIARISAHPSLSVRARYAILSRAPVTPRHGGCWKVVVWSELS